MRIDHEIGKAVSIYKDDGLLLLTYDYASAPKPFFHPLNTPAGHTMTVFQPRDHFWHRGLWFAIKFVNGDNFWEENDPFGSQVTIRPPMLDVSPAGAIEIRSMLNWTHPAYALAPIFESRSVIVHAPDKSCYALDFETTILPSIDVVLDRTPFTTWGGYGGLALRGHRGWQETAIEFSDGTTSSRPTGQTADWAHLTGVLDGGPDLSAGIAILSHPSNPRHPSPWYGQAGYGNFLCAAPLFHEPMPLAKHSRLCLRYRVLIHDGRLESDEVQKEYEIYGAKILPLPATFSLETLAEG
ncbi:MAG: PmoA family protein [Capsulimonadaceae bacterium]|nr:PmoA family protein [Capsulimonadaceae bacterium]